MDYTPTLGVRGELCSLTHECHHWFEGECSGACDRGEHAHPIGSPDCDAWGSALRSSLDSGSTEEKNDD